MAPKGDDKKKKAPKKDKESDERQKAEEEARLKAENEAKEILMRAQIEREARQKFFNQFGDKLVRDIEEGQSAYQGNKDSLKRIHEKKENQIEWAEFRSCSDLPHPFNFAESNTYLSAMLEAQPQGIYPNGLSVLRPIIETLESFAERVKNLSIAIKSRSFSEKYKKEYEDLLYKISNRKLDYVTSWIVQANCFHVETTENFILAEDLSLMCVCLWANVSRNPRLKVADFQLDSLTITTPRDIIMTNVAIRVVYNRGSPCLSHPMFENTNEQGYTIVGGFVRIDLMELVEPPKMSYGWKIKSTTNASYELQTLDYPFKNTEDEQILGDQEEQEEPEKEEDPIIVTFALAEGTFVDPQSAQVMVFDENERKWSREGVLEFEIDSETNIVTLKTTVFGIFAVVQPKNIQFPLNNWEICPFAENQVQVTLNGQKTFFQFVVGESGCKVMLGDDQEDGFLSKWTEPTEFFMKLKSTGFNFTPSSQTEKTLSLLNHANFAILNLSACVKFEMHSMNPLLPQTASSFCFSVGSTNEKHVIVLDDAFEFEGSKYTLCQLKPQSEQLSVEKIMDFHKSITEEQPMSASAMQLIKQKLNVDEYKPQNPFVIDNLQIVLEFIRLLNV